MIERLRREDGIALVVALAFSVALSLLVVGMTTYVTSNQKSAQSSGDDTKARAYAEAALNTAYSRIEYANSTMGTLAGLDPGKSSLLGCSADWNGASNCSSPTPLCLSFTSACPSPYTPTAGTATVYGFFTGTNGSTSFGGLTNVGSSTWILMAVGYSLNANGKLDAKQLRGTVTITGWGSGAVASVWNHVFITQTVPSGSPNSCQQTLSGNGTIWDAPMYVIGNLCLLGNNDAIKEATGGQPIDLQVGGKLVLTGGNGASSAMVGDWSQNPAAGITSGVVVGNCASTTTGATSSCSANFRYKVNQTSSFVPQDAPDISDTDVQGDYMGFDPGPRHPCLSGTNPAPLSTSAFDSTISTGEGSSMVPDNSGSGTAGGVFNLTPSTSYACISQNGAASGYLIWNANPSGGSSITVSGVTVPANTLAINGSIFFDSGVSITQSMTYQGTAIIMAAGQISFASSNMNVCAINTGCTFSNWQGTSGHNDMLTLASVLKNSSSAINWAGNSVTFQGSIYCPPSSTLYYNGNSANTQGPVSVGSMNITGNTFSFKPLPVIKNMPIGAPVPPNVSVTITPLTVIG